MSLKRIIQLFLTMLVGFSFILIGALVPASKLVALLFYIVGIIMVVTNILNIVMSRGKIKFDLVNSIIGTLLGTLMIIFPSKILNFIIVLYLIVIPLLNIFYFKGMWNDRDIIKIIFGIIFLLFSPFFFGIANAIISIFLITIGCIICIGSILRIIVLLRVKNSIHNETKNCINVSKDDVDFDFSDKN